MTDYGSCWNKDICMEVKINAKAQLDLMKEELDAIRSYSSVLFRHAEGIQSDADEALKDAKKIQAIAERKQEEVNEFEREFL